MNVINARAVSSLISIQVVVGRDARASAMVARVNDTAKMVSMIGVEVVVSGIKPHVAMTLIEMGKGLLNTQCVFNLEHGVEKLKEKIAQRGDRAIEGKI